MKISNILVVGGDERQMRCAEILSNFGHKVGCFLVPGYPTENMLKYLNELNNLNELKNLNELNYYLNDVKYILCPIPFSRDKSNITVCGEHADKKLPIELFLSFINESQTLIGGAIEPFVTDILTKRDIPYYDLMTFDSFKETNSQLTAEGLLKDIIEVCPFSIPESNILLAGYGSCGKHIASTLSLLGGHVTIYNKNKSFDCMARASGFTAFTSLPCGSELNNYNIIINTIPAVIFTPAHIDMFNKDACLFEVASSPGGFHIESVKKRGLTYRACPSIPGKTAPMTAARIICHIINEEI